MESDPNWLAQESAAHLGANQGLLEDDYDNAETFGDLEDVGNDDFLTVLSTLALASSVRPPGMSGLSHCHISL